jgi:zinc protease
MKFLQELGYINQDVKNILTVTTEDAVYQKYIKGKHFVTTSFVPKGGQFNLDGSIVAAVVEKKNH